MQSPSEKHLEDWIVANPNELYILGEEDIPMHIVGDIIGRQVRLPSGICDLLSLPPLDSYSSQSVCAVELKKGPITAHTIVQCQRYMRDLRGIFWETLKMVLADKVNDFTYKSPDTAILELGHPSEITGIVIGHSVENDNILIACELAGIQAFTYDMVSADSFWFEPLHVQRTENVCFAYEEFAQGYIGDAFKAIISERIKRERGSR